MNHKMSYIQNSYQAPVQNPGYYDVPIQNAYSNPNQYGGGNYQNVPSNHFNNVIQNNYPQGGYVVQPSNLETFVGSRESSYKYIGNGGYNTNPYAMSINHSNDQFPAQVYTNTGVQLRVDPRMSSSKIEDSAYKAKSQMMGGGYAQQFMPNNPFTMPQMGMNYQNPSMGMGMWAFEPPYAEQGPTFPAVPAQVYAPMMPNMMGQHMGPMGPQMMNGPQMMGGGTMVQRPRPSIRIKDPNDSDEDDVDEDEGVKIKQKRVVQSTSIVKKEKKNKSTLEKVNSFLTDNSTIYWLIVLLVILIVAFVVKAVYVDK